RLEERVRRFELGEREAVPGEGTVSVPGQGAGSAEQEQALRGELAEPESGGGPDSGRRGPARRVPGGADLNERPAVELAVEGAGFEHEVPVPGGAPVGVPITPEHGAPAEERAFVDRHHVAEADRVLEQAVRLGE